MHELDQPYEPNNLLGNIFQEAHSEEGLEELSPHYRALRDTSQHYTQKTLIGKGSIKNVYRCFDERTKRYVALAEPRDHLGQDFFDLFIHEVWLTASLSHPNIINIHDLNIKGDRPYFTMDLKGNTTLQDFIAQGASLHQRLDAFEKICDAVAYAHSKGVLHLDLKPENIQCDAYGEVLVCDWGLAKFKNPTSLQDPPPIAPQLLDENFTTLYGEAKGTPGFMAPEQVHNEFQKDERTDVFSLGCILYFILTGQAPYTGSTEEILASTRTEQVTSFPSTKEKRSIPKGLTAITLKALCINPEQRYPSVTALHEDLQRYLQGRSTLAEKPSIFRKTSLYLKRHPVRVRIITLSLLTLSLLTAFFLKSTRRLENKAAVLTTEMNQLGEDLHGLELSHNKKKAELNLLFSLLSYKLIDPYYQEHPAQILEESKYLLNEATLLKDNFVQSRLVRCEINCIKLNFQEALKINVPEAAQVIRSYQELAKHFPTMNYDAERRPSIPELVSFIQRTQELSFHNPRLLTSIILYDWHARESHEDYTPVILATLQIYKNNNQILTNYDAKASKLTIKNSRGTIRSGYEQINFSLLAYLQVKSLHLETENETDLSMLNEASIEQLDLSKVPSITMTRSTHLHNLKKLIIHDDHPTNGYFQRQLTSSTPYEIIRVPTP